MSSFNGAAGSVRTSTGAYTVSFLQNVSACGLQATLGSAFGFVSATHDPGNGNNVFVNIRATNGTTATNAAFDLLVTC
jgi:hypothetical protein